MCVKAAVTICYVAAFVGQGRKQDVTEGDSYSLEEPG